MRILDIAHSFTLEPMQNYLRSSSSWCSIIFLTLALVGCSDTEQPPQGPTGLLSMPSARESYLIPPEIPATLLDYLFAHQAPRSEIISISIEDFTNAKWTLEITIEQLPDEVRSERRSFSFIDGAWHEQ